ncbi:hypothetical protein PM082_013582 [Marasmius tenuissimus]|nr:hypothetical protein PM082_013582 [Marasmius tenuissimus]
MASTSDITPELITQLILDDSAAPTTASAQLRTVLRFLKGIRDQNAQAILEQLSDDIEYSWIAKGFDQIAPRVKDRKETEAFFTRFLGGNFVKDYTYTCLDYVEMPGKVVLQLKCDGELTSGMGNYDNEYIWIFHLVQHEGDLKIKVAKEFFDSLYCARIWGILPKADQEKLGK